MIVKVSMPSDDTENPCVVIRDEKRSLLMHVPPSVPIKGRMGKLQTCFFHATIEHGSLQLGDIAPWQDW